MIDMLKYDKAKKKSQENLVELIPPDLVFKEKEIYIMQCKSLSCVYGSISNK